MAALTDRAMDDANGEALASLARAQPNWVDVRRAGDVVDLAADEMLHSGPPLVWDEACGALLGAAAGVMIVDGTAPDLRSAEAVVRARSRRLRPGFDLDVLCTFAGVITRATPVFVVEDRASGQRAFTAINEGRGAALRYGCTDEATLARLRWIHDELADVLGRAVRAVGGLALLPILEQALQMGDDGHSRQKAASALLCSALAPAIASTAGDSARAARALTFLGTNDFFFLPLAMATAKIALRRADHVHGSSMVSAMAFNGVRAGIRLVGGREWFTSPVPPLQGAYFKGFGPNDAGPVIGDSEIMETVGLGAFAMAGAPALARYVGGTVEAGSRFTAQMYKITVAEHPQLHIPALDGRGVPLGIDVRKVVASGIAPVFNSGIAHREPGIGQIGAGYGRVPLDCFTRACAALGALPG